MIHRIAIEAVLNGYIAKVGCQTLVFNSRPEMLKELDTYLDKPEETAKRYRESALNAKNLGKEEIPYPPAPASECNYAMPSGSTLSFNPNGATTTATIRT